MLLVVKAPVSISTFMAYFLYIYIYVCVCVCVCEQKRKALFKKKEKVYSDKFRISSCQK